MAEESWHEARLIPTSGINGAEEQERRATSALLAVLSAVIGFPVITAASVEPGQRLKWVGLSCALALLFPVLMYLGAARIVPAAPLRLVDAAIGTADGLAGRTLRTSPANRALAVWPAQCRR